MFDLDALWCYDGRRMEEVDWRGGDRGSMRTEVVDVMGLPQGTWTEDVSHDVDTGRDKTL